MESKVKRPLLLTGLILALVAFAIFAIVLIMAMIVLPAVVDQMYGDTAMVDAVYGVAVFLLVLFLIFVILGVIFAAISISRWNLAPEAFDKKKGLITTTFVFSVITAVFGFITILFAFDVLNLLLVIALILAAVFIMIDRTKNKELLEQAKVDAQNTALQTEMEKPAEPTKQVQPAEQQPEQTENKPE